MTNNFYITTPIYYVNAKPHIGHAYTSIACDVVARIQRSIGKNVYFLTGTDEHGIKVEQSAKKNNIEPKEFTDQISKHFIDLAKAINCSNNDFIRTTEPRHIEGSQYFWNKLYEKGYIYKDSYAGWYSVRDESFYSESELIDGKAPSGAEVEWIEEESYFFKLSAFQDKLLQFYDDNPDFIYPKSRLNEVVSFVKGGKEYISGALLDLSISRTSFKWGVPVPNDDKHIMYVWLDALSNYLTALSFHKNGSELYEKFWPANMHIVGKDILRFHAVYWPAFLMAVDIPLPKKIIAHGWWTNNKEKISKSLGNIIDPLELISKFGVDPLRYFLLKEISFGNDGDYSEDSFILRINSELANNIGNLVQRVTSMIDKYYSKKIPQHNNLTTEDTDLIESSYLLLDQLNNIENLLNDCKFNTILNDIITIASKANTYIEIHKPWVLFKEDKNKLDNILFVLIEVIRNISIRLLPFMPDSCTIILDALNIDKKERNYIHCNSSYQIKCNSNIDIVKNLFPKF